MFIGAIGHHTGDQALVEWLLGEILIVLLEVLFRRCDELHGHKFVATRRMSLLGWERRISLDIDIPTLLEAGDDVSNEPTLDAIRLDSNEATSNVNHTAKKSIGGAELHVFSLLMASDSSFSTLDLFICRRRPCVFGFRYLKIGGS